MSDAEYDKRSANIESRDANMNQSGSESHSTEQSNAKKFTVKKLKFAPEIDVPPTQNSDGSAEASGKQSPQSPTSSGQQFTYGYATNEAIPMTVFYRSQHSQGHSGKQRPTLQQLRKGFENDREDLTEQGAVIAENEAEGDMLEVGTRGPSKAPKFGWVKGVLIRCLLNIWGVILYRRLAWVVGHAGIGLASLIILLSAMVTTLTTLSMSAICTNGEIKGGDGK